MRNKLVYVLCWFIPSRQMRHRLWDWAQRAQYKNNIIEVVHPNGKRIRVKRVKGCKFTFTGDNNHIVLHKPLGKSQIKINVSWGVYAELYPSTKYQRKINIIKTGGQHETNRIVIGRDLRTTDWTSILLAHGSGDVIIGDNCLFAVDVIFRTGDFHTIYCANTGRVLNFNKSITIGNHVWIAERVILLKGAGVADNSIVGARSLVNKKFDKTNIIIAGVPAKIVKEEINWDVCPPNQYAMNNNLQVD